MKRKSASPSIEQPARATRRLRVDQSESAPSRGQHASVRAQVMNSGRSDAHDVWDRTFAGRHAMLVPPMQQYMNLPPYVHLPVRDPQVAHNASDDGPPRFPVDYHRPRIIPPNANASHIPVQHGTLIAPAASHAHQASVRYPSQAAIPQQEMRFSVDLQPLLTVNRPVDSLLPNNTSRIPLLGGHSATSRAYTQQAAMGGPSLPHQFLPYDVMQYGWNDSRQPWVPQEGLQRSILPPSVPLPNARYDPSFHRHGMVPSEQLTQAGMGMYAVQRQQDFNHAMHSVPVASHNPSSSFVPINASLANVPTDSHDHQSQLEERGPSVKDSSNRNESNELEDSIEVKAEFYYDTEEDYSIDSEMESSLHDGETTFEGDNDACRWYYDSLKRDLRDNKEKLKLSESGLGHILKAPDRFIRLFSRKSSVKTVELEVAGLLDPGCIVKIENIFSALKGIEELKLWGWRDLSGWTAAADLVQRARWIQTLEFAAPQGFDVNRFASSLEGHPSIEMIRLVALSPEDSHVVDEPSSACASYVKSKLKTKK